MKKIMAVLATIAAVLGFGFASQSAMAADYGATVTPGDTGYVVTVNFPAGTFQGGEEVKVDYDAAAVTKIEQVASQTFTAKEDGSLTVKITFSSAFAGKTVTLTFTGLTSGTVKTVKVKVPGAAKPAQGLPQTGAAVAPYAVAVALLAAAGIALAAVRKTTAR